MAHKKQQPRFAWGEYIKQHPDQNIEIAGARIEFIRVVQRVLPRFMERLRETVYPFYSALRRQERPENMAGLEQLSESVSQPLLAWAEKFNAAGEPWILEGALRTLSRWHDDAELRDSLGIHGFYSYPAVDTLSSGAEEAFHLRYPGWDPQFETWPTFRNSIETAFHKQLSVYEQRLRTQMESQGAVRARRRYSTDNLTWFALYQLGAMSATRILRHRPDLKGDESTILKGVKTAAELLRWSDIR